MTTYAGIDISNATSAFIHGATGVYYDESKFAKYGVDFMMDLIIKRAEQEQEEHPDIVVWVTIYCDIDDDCYDTLVDQPIAGYQPVATEITEDDVGFSVKIVDESNWKPDVWVDVYNFDAEYPTVDWNMWIFSKYNGYEMAVKHFQEECLKNDGYWWNLIEECAIDYIYANHKIEECGNGYRRL